jgi:beta-barrel assembly-enhancing protease
MSIVVASAPVHARQEGDMRGFVWLAVGLVLACGVRQRVETAAAEALISDEQSQQLGDRLHAELEQRGVEFVDDPVVRSYVDRLAAPLLERAREERPGIGYEVHVIDEPEEVNAFATPGGHLYVTSGLIAAVEDPSELAGVLAHEAAHVALRHPERQMVQAYGLEALAQLALGEDPALAGEIAAQVAGTGVLLAHSRSAEEEADRWAADAMARVDVDPRGLVRFLETIQEREGETPRALRWVSTHPTTADRIEDLREHIRENDLARPGGGAPGGLQAVKERLGGTG